MIPEHIVATAKLLNIRIITDYRDPMRTGKNNLALVRSPHSNGVIAYIHAEMTADMIRTDADWIELFVQLWPGIEK